MCGASEYPNRSVLAVLSLFFLFSLTFTKSAAHGSALPGFSVRPIILRPWRHGLKMARTISPNRFQPPELSERLWACVQ